MHKPKPVARKRSSVAVALYNLFFAEHVALPRKKIKVEKQTKLSWSSPHQGEREKARRRRQLKAGTISSYPGV